MLPGLHSQRGARSAWYTRFVPLRISSQRIWLYGSALFVLGLLPAILAHPGDWPRFWAAGATVGTGTLLDPSSHIAYQIAHGLSTGVWTYPPAFAWAFVPAAHLPIAVGYALNFALTLCGVALSGWILAGVFGFERWFGVVASLAWQPALYAAAVGQTSGIWLFFTVLAIAAAVRGSVPGLGGAVGMLLLKPTFGLPFAAVLLARRQSKTCAIVVLFAAVLYLASVAATGGNWRWIPEYAATLKALSHTDLGALYNGITLPMILARLGAPPVVAIALGASAFIAFLPGLARASAVQAMSLTSFLAIVLSPHAWMYDATLMLPALFYAMRYMEEPWRTRVVVAAYILAAAWMPGVLLLRFNLLALIGLAGAVLCAIALYGKQESARALR